MDKAKADSLILKDSPEFRCWTKALPDGYWAKYDLSACKLGWEVAMEENAKLRAELELSLKRQIQFQDAHTEEQERADALQSRLDAYEKQVLPEEVERASDCLHSFISLAAAADCDLDWALIEQDIADVDALLGRLAHQQAASDKALRDFNYVLERISHSTENDGFHGAFPTGDAVLAKDVISNPEHRPTIERLQGNDDG